VRHPARVSSGPSRGPFGPLAHLHTTRPVIPTARSVRRASSKRASRVLEAHNGHEDLSEQDRARCRNDWQAQRSPQGDRHCSSPRATPNTTTRKHLHSLRPLPARHSDDSRNSSREPFPAFPGTIHKPERFPRSPLLRGNHQEPLQRELPSATAHIKSVPPPEATAVLGLAAALRTRKTRGGFAGRAWPDARPCSRLRAPSG